MKQYERIIIAAAFWISVFVCCYVIGSGRKESIERHEEVQSAVDRVAVSVNRLEATSGEAIIQLLQHTAKLEKRVVELERINSERAGVGAAGTGDSGDDGESSGGVSDQASDL